MSNVTKTVKSSGGDYTSLNAALSGMSGDLTSNCGGTGTAGILTIECYAMSDTTAVDTGTGYTTSSSYYINITVPTAERHDGKWNTSKYRLEISSNAPGIYAQANDINITGLQISHSYDGYQQCIVCFGESSGTSTYFIDKCIIKGLDDYSGGITITGYADNATIRNSVIYKPSSVGQSLGDEGVLIETGSITIQNCTIFNFNDGVELDGGSATITNCAVFGNGDDFDIDGTATISYCASDDGDGTNAVNISPGATEADDWADAFVDYANGDFHIKDTDSVLYNAGTDLSGTFTNDIDGDTRSQWDIGADEYVAAGGASVTLSMSSCVQSNVGGVPSLALQTNLVVANSTNQNVGNAIGSPPLQTSLSIANGVNANIGNAISDVPLQAIVSTADGIQKNVGDAIGLTSEFLLELFDGIQQNVCDVANITVEFVLLNADGVQQNVTGLITLVVESDTGTEYTLTIYDGAQVQVGEALNLSLETSLPTVDGAQRNYSDAIELVAEYLMSVLGSYHVNAGDAIGDLPIQITVTMSDGTQVIVSDAFDLSGKITLALANGIQITTDDMSAITIEALLNTLDGIQKNVGGEILLSVSSAGDIISRILRVVSKTPNRQITSKTPVRTIASKTTTKTIHLIVD